MKNKLGDIIKKDENYIMPVKGAVINRFVIDNRFCMQFLELNDPMDILIEGKFFINFEGTKQEFDIQKFDTLGPAFHLFQKEIEYGKVYKNGNLEIKFKEGMLLTAPFDNKYECWEINTKSGVKIISLPGGELAIWERNRDTELLTLDEIKEANDTEIIETIYNTAMRYISSRENPVKSFSNLPIGYQAVFSIVLTQAEIDNGGFYQYFGNSTAEEYYPFVLSSYKRIGAFAVVDILEKVWGQITKSKTFLAKYEKIGIRKAFNEANEKEEINTDETLENEFYKSEKEVQNLLLKYIRTNLKDF